MSEKVIAFCGLDCAACPAYHAAEKLSMAEREKVAGDWSKQFNAPIKAVDIDCTGCTAKDGTHVAYCARCQIRAGGAGRGLSTCASCPEFACKKLADFMQNVPAARSNLEALRAS